MRITGPHLPGFPMLDIDMGRGKLSAQLDLRSFEERDRLAALLRESQILVQGYRPGALAALGFSPEACAEMRPGIVAVTLSAYGHAGPWAGRRGFDSLVQNACGINWMEAEALGVAPPKELPAQALDHATGFLMAFGATMALLRKMREGGSWLVRVSLAQTAHWLTQLGQMEGGFDCPEPGEAEIEALRDAMDTPLGRLSFIRHAALLSETPARWSRPPVALGTHAPVWPV
jgi:crotonobetainyl-CoA:carnitine CoA-transferase CaiB-like acyl-CoA transferase